MALCSCLLKAAQKKWQGENSKAKYGTGKMPQMKNWQKWHIDSKCA